MSMTFWSDADHDGVNMANGNAHDVMDFVGVEFDYSGEIPARELAVRCGRALIHDVTDVVDPGRPEVRQGCVITCARHPGYLLDRARQLRELAIKTGDGNVYWG